MTQIIPLTNATSTFRQTCILDGVEYGLILNWNTRSHLWFLTVEDVDGNILAAGRKIVADKPLLQRDTNSSLPPGDLWCITVDGVDPGLRDLGRQTQLLYVEAE